MRYIQHPITHELVPAEEYERPSARHHIVQGDIEPFISPIDKTVISSRAHLREHNLRHGVTNSADYTPEFLARRREQIEDKKGSARERKQQLYDAMIAHNL